MTDNEKIARWAGWKCVLGDWVAPSGHCEKLGCCPNYSTDAEAIQLLNVLAEKDYNVTLEHDSYGWIVCFRRSEDVVFVYKDGGYKPTIHEAIVAAVLQVIEEEELN